MNIDWFTFVAQIINFMVLVYLLSRFLYGPITRAMERREAEIAFRLEEAHRQQQDAEVAESRFLELSQNIELQRNEFLEQARAESEVTRQTLVQDARAEIQSRRDEWQQALIREQSTLINLVRQRASNQVVAVSRGALSQLADVELEEQTIASFLRKIGELPVEQIDQLKQESTQGQKIQIRTGFDVSEEWQRRIQAALKKQLGYEQVTFETFKELICGIELHVGGSKIGWSIQEYLESLTDELQGMWVKE
jgi:F-type H+-transporting ATPase subunit b